MKKHSIQIILAITGIFTLFVAFNWLVDPYWIYETPRIARFNSNKPVASDNSRLFKISRVLQQQPEALIIGTSREDSGINPKHAVFQGHNVFNAAISSQPNVESKKILQAMSDHGDFPRQIIFGLIFENANVFGFALPADYSEENFNEYRRYKLLLSLSTLKASAKTVALNLAGKTKKISNDGFRNPSEWTDQLLIGHHKAFKDNERHYLFDNHFPLPACKNALVVEDANRKSATPMQELRDAIIIAYRMKSDMRIFIGPSHARQWETIQASGLWGQFEDWKRMVVEIVELEAIEANATPLQVWDFSGYNSISVEPVPPESDKLTRMRYYYESSHYTPAAGDLVLDRIFNLKSPERTIPDDFGVLLTSHNIDAHLTNIRVAREHYRQTHPEDVAEIEAMAREVVKTKHCQPTK